MIWDASNLLKSGGYSGPNIPFDIVVEMDIDDPRTWKVPSQTLLDLGFNIWFKQKPTKNYPQAYKTPIYLGKIEGSLLKHFGGGHTLLDIQNRTFVVIGDWDTTDFIIVEFVSKTLTRKDNIIVMATGKVSEVYLTSRGSYHKYEVKPISKEAKKLFGKRKSMWILKPMLMSLKWEKDIEYKRVKKNGE